jgi:hypothetical protein
MYVYIWQQFVWNWGFWKTPFQILPGLEIWFDVDLGIISELCKVSSPWRYSNIDFLAPKIGDFEKSLQFRITMLASFTMSICCECGRSKICGRACQRRDRKCDWDCRTVWVPMRLATAGNRNHGETEIMKYTSHFSNLFSLNSVFLSTS